MKTVITSTSDSLSANYDKRFGRGAWFCIYDEDTKVVEFVVNENKDANSGAGTKVAELMVELGVTKVISGDFGPKAKDLLEKFNVQMVIVEDKHQTVQDILDLLSN